MHKDPQIPGIVSKGKIFKLINPIGASNFKSKIFTNDIKIK